MGSSDSKGDEDTLNSNVSDSLCQVDRMDLLEGNAFSDGGGAACTKFKTNMMYLIHTHHMDILFICEPHISSGKAASITKSLAMYASPCGIKRAKLWEYLSFIDDCQHLPWLIAGPKFTSNNKKVFERLDQAICNLEWRGLFAEATVKHFPRTKLDHNPIKICLTSCFSTPPMLRPFRFEAMWLQHEKFNEFIYES
ncbi:unnamed protein product [Prunus armeniaca]